MVKKENKNIFIVILVVIGLFYLIGQGDDVSITDGLDEDLMNKQSKFSDVPWTIESRLSPMSEEDRISYLENVYKKKTNIGGATCSSLPDRSECIESGLTITCPSSFEGDTNYGCAIQLWTAVNDDCSYDVHQTWLGETQLLAGQSKTFTGEDAYFYDIYMCTDIGCLCESATNKGCGDWDCDDDEMTRVRTCEPHDCGDVAGWTEQADEWYYCASGFSECIDCDSHELYRCYNNDIYWYDSCGGMEEKKLPDCGVPGCDYGSTVCSGGTTPSLIEVSRTIKDYNDLGVENKIVGTFVLKNNGGAMTENWILEMQVNKLAQVQAVYVDDTQKTCNPATPYNVHKEFKLGAGEQVTIKLTSSNIPESMILTNGNTYVLGVITEECGCTETSCYKDPYKAGKSFGQHVVKDDGVEEEEEPEVDACGGECDGIIMVCDKSTGDCKLNSLIYLVGGFLALVFVMKAWSGKS